MTPMTPEEVRTKAWGDVATSITVRLSGDEELSAHYVETESNNTVPLANFMLYCHEMTQAMATALEAVINLSASNEGVAPLELWRPLALALEQASATPPS